MSAPTYEEKETYEAIIAKLESQLAKAITALEPFAEKADKYPVETWDDEEFIRVALSDLRLASTTLAELKGE